MADELFEFEVHVSTNDDVKRGVLALVIVKALVAAPTWWEAHKTCVALVWRGDRTITGIYWVP